MTLPFLHTPSFSRLLSHTYTDTHSAIDGLSQPRTTICFSTNTQQRTSTTRDLLFLLWHQSRRITVLISGMLCCVSGTCACTISDMVICHAYLLSRLQYAVVCFGERDREEKYKSTCTSAKTDIIGFDLIELIIMETIS